MSEERERYIILDVDFDGRTNYGRELSWIAPALKDAPGLELTEDDVEDDDGRQFCHNCGKEIEPGSDPRCFAADACGESCEPVTMHRKWSGAIPESVYQKLVSDWSIDSDDSEPNMGMLTEYGHLEGYRFHWSGMDWNSGGETPIQYVSLSVSVYVDEVVTA